ncbi:protease modulator HflC, partial [Oligoflexia bacterium]|nr:protease modulator HflC [Oligoflexia bacterium]
IDSATREVISSHDLVETVRNTNDIVELVALRAKERRALEENPDVNRDIIEILEEESSGEILKIALGREKLSEKILARARPDMEANGLSLIDVQLRRIAYEQSVEAKVYDRMMTERQRIASKLRSIGKGEQAKIQGKKERELQEIQSEAYRSVQKIKGNAEAQAIKIYAEAVGQNTKLYEFLRSIEMYQYGLRSDSKLILSSDAAFMKFLMDGPE